MRLEKIGHVALEQYIGKPEDFHGQAGIMTAPGHFTTVRLPWRIVIGQDDDLLTARGDELARVLAPPLPGAPGVRRGWHLERP